MSTSSVAANMRISKRDGLWLAMDVLVHTLVLLIPIQADPPSVSKDRAISISLHPTHGGGRFVVIDTPWAPRHDPLAMLEIVQRPRLFQYITNQKLRRCLGTVQVLGGKSGPRMVVFIKCVNDQVEGQRQCKQDKSPAQGLPDKRSANFSMKTAQVKGNHGKDESDKRDPDD